MLTPLVIICVTAAVSWLLGFAIYWLLHHFEIIDCPNQRSCHSTPTVRGGGITMVVAVIGISLWLVWRFECLPLLLFGVCMLALAGISFVDDLRSIGIAFRFGVHFVAALVIIFGLVSTRTAAGFPSHEAVLSPALGSSAFACLWIVGYTNAFNFMDGINGIAGGQAVVTSLGMALLAGLALGDLDLPPVLLSFAIAGASLGFLPHNFPRARMFMGDVGSAPLGFLLGLLVVWLTRIAGFWLFIPLALLHANFVLDTAITLIRRAARGDKWYTAHREHFYQRLVRSGRSHAFVTGWEMSLQGVVLVLMVFYLKANDLLRVGLAVTVVLIWLGFFTFCEISFHRSLVRLAVKLDMHPYVRADV